MKSAARASLTLASLFAVPAALAQHADLEEIVVTANPLRSSALQLAQSAIVLAGDDLARNVGPSLGESLASQPGVTASYFGPKASRPIIRGLSGERVLMLLDGVSALDVSNLSPDHSVSVEPLLADQIEILKGPTTLLYGSGAVGGVVNTVDGRIPMRKDREPIEGGLELRADTASEERSVAGRLDGAVGSLAWHVDGYSRDTSDIEIPGLDWSKALIAEKTAEGEPIEATRGYVPNTDSESDGVTAGFAWIGERSLVGFAWGRAETNYGLPGPAEHAHEEAPAASAMAALAAEEEEEAVRIDQTADRYDFKAEWRELGGLLDNVALRAAYTDYEHDELEGDEIGTSFEQTGLDTRLHLGHRAIAGWTGTLGLQYTDLDLEAIGAEAYIPPSQTTGIAAFLVEQQRFGDWTVETDTSTTSTITVRCTNGTGYVVNLDAGLHATGDINLRQMDGPGTVNVRYNLYTDTDLIWGNGTTGANDGGAGAGMGSPQNLTVTGKLFVADNQGAIEPGAYADTVTATIVY